MKKLLLAMLLALMLVPMSAWGDFGPVPYEIWAETVYYQTMDPHQGGNPLGHGQVLIDGNKTIIAEGDSGVLLYGDEQVNGTALVARTEDQNVVDYIAKGATMLNGRLYAQGASTNIVHCKPWFEKDAPAADQWNFPGFDTGRGSKYSSHDTYGLLTDGTYLYSSANFSLAGQSEDGGSEHNCITKVYKWVVDPVTHDVIGNAPGWPITIYDEGDPHHYLISMGYYNGKLYAAEGYDGRNIFEIDCETGEYHKILSGDNLIPEELATTYFMGQIARCGDTIVLANWTGHLTVWKLKSGVWTLTACNFMPRPYIDVQYFLGLSLKPGPDGNAKYAWTSSGSWVQFYDLDPQFTPVSLGEARKMKNGYPSGVKDAVVTKVGTGEYWIEDKDRSSGCRVVGDIAPDAVGKLVSMTGSMNTTNAGEKYFTPNVTPQIGDVAVPAIKPLYLNNKDMGGVGLATDGMLVKVTGRCTKVDIVEGDIPVAVVYFDDGSGLASDIPDITGVKTQLTDVFSSPYLLAAFENPSGFEVTVTGIVRLEKLTDGTIIKKIDALSDADVIIDPIE